MTIVEQAEHELRLLILCTPSTARGLIEEITRLRAELAGKRLSPEVTTMCVCNDCGAITRWSRHLDLDCHTIATLRAELETANALVKRHEAALDLIWSWAHICTFHVSRDIESGVVTFGIFNKVAQEFASRGCDTQLAAIEAAMKEKP